MDPAFPETQPELAAEFEAEFCKYKSTVPYVHTVACNMAQHSLPYYERALKEGFNSYVPRIEKIEDKELRDGLLGIIEGLRNYHSRCLKYLKEVGADEKLLGRIQMQVTCINPEMLKQAYDNPEFHKNLVIRVGGYSDYFCNLSDDLKKMVIKRNTHK